MKTASLFALSGLALATGLMASPPLDPAGLEIKPAAKPKPAVEAVPEIAICREAPVQIEKRLVSRTHVAPVRQLRDMEANEESIQSIIQNEDAKTAIDKLKAHIVLKSMEDALKHLTRESMEKIDVDFENHQLAIFAWQGSGQDRLNGHGFLNKAKVNVANFNYMPGHTEDLRTHSMIYLMPKDAEIKVNNLEARVIRCGVGEARPMPIPVEPGCDLQVIPMPEGGKIELKVEPLKLQGAPQQLQLKIQPKIGE